MMKLLLAASLFLVALPLSASPAVYLVRGSGASYFDQYDIDGFSVEAASDHRGLRLTVRAAAVAQSRSPYDPSVRRLLRLPSAPDRDAVAAELVRGARLEVDAVRGILGWIYGHLRYDADQNLPQGPAEVFRSRRADCVGAASLAVDLLGRAGIRAETVQGIFVVAPGDPGYSAQLSGAYHRWIRVFYPDCGWQFADPMVPDGRVDDRYIPFARHAWTRPRNLEVTIVPEGVK